MYDLEFSHSLAQDRAHEQAEQAQSEQEQDAVYPPYYRLETGEVVYRDSRHEERKEYAAKQEEERQTLRMIRINLTGGKHYTVRGDAAFIEGIFADFVAGVRVIDITADEGGDNATRDYGWVTRRMLINTAHIVSITETVKAD